MVVLPHPSPPLWIPAFAGMTKWGGRHDEMGRRNDDGGGRPAVRGWWLDGVLPHPPPPLWIPAFAGMTKWGAGALGKVGWAPMHRGGSATLLAAPLDSGLRRNKAGIQRGG